MSEQGDNLRELADLKDEEEDIKEELKDEVRMSWLSNQLIDSHEDISKNYAQEFNLSLTDAKKQLNTFPGDYKIDNVDIPTLVKSLRNHRRTLKGEEKIKFTKGITNLIDAYSDHLDSCVKSIYWLAPYERPFREMGFNEKDLFKLSKLECGEKRQELVDILCKYWENQLYRKGRPYNEKYSSLSKHMMNNKREFRKCIKSINVNPTLKETLDDSIVKAVCEYPGISARQIIDTLPNKLQKRVSHYMISKSAARLNIGIANEQYYKLPDLFKKDLYSYCAAFIDSDGYITMDKGYNPRVGMVATGNRGKAFLKELHKSLGIGKLVLDEKSPQNTRPVNRLNFYSQNDITELLNKCRPHFRMKGPQADVLTELIRMKKSHKKVDWYKPRCGELFNLMKWYNHGENPNYDWTKYEINIENISKYKSNCKMSMMDKLEQVGGN
tara:strand:- start:2264 stop:3583 length:1320 start_codon:yes stop_codon:yes gene_type:complete